MGYKNSIDSATLVNKCLELIEAHYLFDIPLTKLDILIHPESLVHSIIEDHNYVSKLIYFHNDMKIPIINFLNNEDCNYLPINKKFNFINELTLNFTKVDFEIYPIYNYFKQGFAQVSNPPLDAIREKLVTQRSVPLGRRANIFEETSIHCKTLRIDHPILTNDELETIISSKIEGINTVTISTNFKINNGVNSLNKAIERIQKQAETAIKNGSTIIILSDRGIDENHSFIPSLLAVGSVHHYLIKKRIRSQADIIIESGEPREVHHFATLFGYGASAINPYLAYESIEGLRILSKQKKEIPGNKNS